MSDVSFNGNTPVIEGTWVNPRTGDRFTVKNCFLSDNKFIIQTTDGRMLSYEQMSSYVQDDGKTQFKPQSQNKEEQIPVDVLKELEDSGSLVGKSLADLDTRLQAPIMDDLDNEVKQLLEVPTRGPIKNIYYEPLQNNQPLQQNTPLEYKIIDKLISTVYGDIKKPFDIKVKVDFNKPQILSEKLKIITDDFDISTDTVADYLIEKYIDVDSFVKDIVDEVNNVIHNINTVQENTTVTDDQEVLVVETKPLKQKTKKPTTSKKSSQSKSSEKITKKHG